MLRETCLWSWVDTGNYDTECGHAANSVTLAGADEADTSAHECFFCGREIEYEE